MRRIGMTLMAFSATLVFAACQNQRGSAPVSDVSSIQSADGLSIAYQIQGEGDISLVFIHDWCLDMSYWDRQIPSYRVYYQVVTLDLPGHGKSGKGRTQWSLEGYGTDVAALIRELNLPKVVLVGHGMGGIVALLAAAQEPDRVIGVLGANSFSDIYMEPLSRQRIEAMLDIFGPDFQEGMRRYILENYFTSDASENYKRKLIFQMGGVQPEMALLLLEELMEFDGTQALKKLRIPIRTLNAELPIIPFRICRTHAEDFKVRFLKSTGHLVMRDNADVFNRYMATFLGDIITASYQRQ